MCALNPRGGSFVRRGNLNPTRVMGRNKTSSHNKREYTKNEEAKFPLFLSYHIDKGKNKGATDESKF